jgi:hypothetical protein
MPNDSGDHAEEVVARLVRRCADPLTEERLEKCRKRFSSELDKRPHRSGRWLALAAAAFVAALSAWLIGGEHLPGGSPGSQEAAPRSKEIDAWVSRLGHESSVERDRAEKNILGLTADVAYALEALEKRDSSDDLELRSRARAMRAQLSRRAKELGAASGSIRDGIAKTRAAWLKRQYSNFDELVRASFKPVAISYVRYAPKVEIADHLESANNEDYDQFRPYARFGGRRDLLTREVYSALDGGDGIVGLGGGMRPVVAKKGDDLTFWGQCLLFTLPDGTKSADGKARWDCYVVIAFPTPDAGK